MKKLNIQVPRELVFQAWDSMRLPQPVHRLWAPSNLAMWHQPTALRKLGRTVAAATPTSPLSPMLGERGVD